MLPNIAGNVAKHSEECRQTFPGNVTKHSRECSQTYRGMYLNIWGNVLKYLGECWQIFWEMPSNIWRVSSGILGNVCVTQGDEAAESVQDFMEFVVQNIAWNL